MENTGQVLHNKFIDREDTLEDLDLSNGKMIISKEEELPRLSLGRDFKEVSQIRTRTSLNITYNEKKKTTTLVIPYSDKEEVYKVTPEEIDYSDRKDYILQGVEKFNKIISMNKSYVPIGYLLLLGMLYFVVFLMLLYVGTLIALLCMLNPMIILLIVFVIVHFIKLLMIGYLSIKESFKKKKVKGALIEENKVAIKSYNLIWEYGRDGAWLEVIKREENE